MEREGGIIHDVEFGASLISPGLGETYCDYYVPALFVVTWKARVLPNSYGDSFIL